MLLKVLDQKYELVNQENKVEQIYKQVEITLLDTDYLLSYFIVDGIEVYEDLNIYLLDYDMEIKEVEAKVKTKKEFIADIMVSTGTYLVRAIPEIEVLINEFYRGVNESTWGKFEQLLDAVQWINKLISSIDQSGQHPTNWKQYITINAAIQVQLSSLEEAIGNNDTVLLADLLQYEILPLFKDLQGEVGKTIDEEGYHHDTH